MTFFAEWQANAAGGEYPPFCIIRGKCVVPGCTPMGSASWLNIRYMNDLQQLDMLGELLYYARMAAEKGQLHVMLNHTATKRDHPGWQDDLLPTEQMMQRADVPLTCDADGDPLIQEFVPAWVPREVTPATRYTFESVHALCGKHMEQARVPLAELHTLAALGLRRHNEGGSSRTNDLYAKPHQQGEVATVLRDYLTLPEFGLEVPYPGPEKSCWYGDDEKRDAPLDLYPV